MRNLYLIFALLGICGGCSVVKHRGHSPPQLEPLNAPRELSKATLPIYRIEPPDILDIEVVRTVPRADYVLNTTDVIRVRVGRDSIDKIIAGDLLSIRVPGAPAVTPVDGNFLVQPDGTVSLGTPFGSVRLVGLTLEEARKTIEQSLAKQLRAPETTIALAQAGIPVDGEFAIEIDGKVDFGKPYGRVQLDGLTLNGAREVLQQHFEKLLSEPSITLNLIQTSLLQQVVGEHLVGPDGFITLGIYGSVRVVGLTVDEANAAIEATLSAILDEPKVATSVLSYNSKLFYIITQGPGVGDAVYRYPITGNETVLDALSLIQGIPQGSSNRMWIARPSGERGKHQILPVKWDQLSAVAETSTNYQLLPGDRLYVQRDPFVTFDTRLAKFISPIERVLGFSILGAETATRFAGRVLAGGGNPRVGF